MMERSKKTMSEEHRNLFDYYSGPHRGGDAYKARVLENNVTKALLNTVDLRPNLGRRFIDWLNEKHLRQRGLSLNLPDISEVRILQGLNDDEKKDVNITKILLGIKKHRGDYESHTRKGERVDGAIVGQGWLVAIESKLEGMDIRQFKAEKKKIKATEVIQVLWKDVKECFEKALEVEDKEVFNETDRFLIQQLTDFLRLKGLIPFLGFRKKHLDFFLKDQAERDDEREEIKNLFKELLGELTRYKYIEDDKYSEDGERLDNLYWEWEPRVKGFGKKDDYVELWFYCRSKSSSIPVKVTLWADGGEEQRGYLEVYAHIEDENELKRLANFIEKRGGRCKLARKLRSDQFNGYYIGLYDEKWHKIDAYTSTEITNANLIKLGEKTREMAHEKVNFVLAKVFILDTPVSAGVTQLPSDGEGQLKEIAKAMRALQPFALFASGIPWEKIKEW